MWTRPDIEAFKHIVSQAEGDGVVRVGHGETVTVRVPTHPAGSRLFWEFATDHYDIGELMFTELVFQHRHFTYNVRHKRVLLVFVFQAKY